MEDKTLRSKALYIWQRLFTHCKASFLMYSVSSMKQYICLISDKLILLVSYCRYQVFSFSAEEKKFQFFFYHHVIIPSLGWSVIMLFHRLLFLPSISSFIHQCNLGKSNMAFLFNKNLLIWCWMDCSQELWSNCKGRCCLSFPPESSHPDLNITVPWWNINVFLPRVSRN